MNGDWFNGGANLNSFAIYSNGATGTIVVGGRGSVLAVADEVLPVAGGVLAGVGGFADAEAAAVVGDALGRGRIGAGGASGTSAGAVAAAAGAWLGVGVTGAGVTAAVAAAFGRGRGIGVR
jgi:hypothetical protein